MIFFEIKAHMQRSLTDFGVDKELQELDHCKGRAHCGRLRYACQRVLLGWLLETSVTPVDRWYYTKLQEREAIVL